MQQSKISRMENSNERRPPPYIPAYPQRYQVAGQPNFFYTHADALTYVTPTSTAYTSAVFTPSKSHKPLDYFTANCQPVRPHSHHGQQQFLRKSGVGESSPTSSVLIPSPHKNMTLEELARFRTHICPRKSANNVCALDEHCPFSHCLSWHRRNPLQAGYRPTLCPNVIFNIGSDKKMRVKNYCKRRRLCLYSHTKEEQMYHPLVYKTQICRDYPNCKKHYCPFAHGEGELRDASTLQKELAMHLTKQQKSPDHPSLMTRRAEAGQGGTSHHLFEGSIVPDSTEWPLYIEAALNAAAAANSSPPLRRCGSDVNQLQDETFARPIMSSEPTTTDSSDAGCNTLVDMLLNTDGARRNDSGKTFINNDTSSACSVRGSTPTTTTTPDYQNSNDCSNIEQGENRATSGTPSLLPAMPPSLYADVHQQWLLQQIWGQQQDAVIVNRSTGETNSGEQHCNNEWKNKKDAVASASFSLCCCNSSGNGGKAKEGAAGRRRQLRRNATNAVPSYTLSTSDCCITKKNEDAKKWGERGEACGNNERGCNSLSSHSSPLSPTTAESGKGATRHSDDASLLYARTHRNNIENDCNKTAERTMSCFAFATQQEGDNDALHGFEETQQDNNDDNLFGGRRRRVLLFGEDEQLSNFDSLFPASSPPPAITANSLFSVNSAMLSSSASPHHHSSAIFARDSCEYGYNNSRLFNVENHKHSADVYGRSAAPVLECS